MRVLLFLLATFLPLLAQERLIHQVYDTATDTNVEVLALFTRPAPSGYFPVRVKISNNLKNERGVTLDFQSTNSSNGTLRCNSNFSFSAGPGKSITRDILVPIAPPSGTSYSNSNLNFLLSGSLGSASQNVYGNFGSEQPAVLLSESLFTPNASSLDAAARSSSSGSYSSGTNFAAKFDPKQLPDEWLAFAGYDSLILTDADWTNIPPGGRNAVLSWLRMGGQLVVYTLGKSSAAELGLPSDTGFGRLEIKPIATLLLDERATVALVSPKSNPPLQTSLTNDYSGGWPLQAHFGGKQFRYALFVIVLILFAILVGPVNLFVFAKSGQRHKLFITTPLISLGASLVLIILIIAQDGFGGNGMRRVLMEVRPDAGINAAYVHQEQFCRTGVLTGSSFTIPTPATMTPVPISASRWARFTGSDRADANFHLQPEGGKIQASGDWFQSRSEQGEVLSAVISTRGRIERTDTPGTFLSTFAFPIEKLYFRDAAGNWFRAERIESGKKFTPVAVEVAMAESELKLEAKAFAARNKRFLTDTMERPDHYIAVTTQAPGIDTLPGINWKETKTVITGPVVAP